MLIKKSESNLVKAPDILMVGAAKSGTTTLYKWLDQHPDIYFPPHRKEPFYFSFANTKPEFTDPEFAGSLIWKVTDYLQLYKNAPEGKLLADGSTSYLYHGQRAIKNIQSFYGERAKELSIVIILRNPVERAFSHYTYLIRNGHESLTFAQAIEEQTIEKRKGQRWGFDYIRYGMYYEQVKLYMDAFPNTKVLLFSDLKTPQSTFDSLCGFLQIKQHPVPKNVHSNPSGVPKSKFLVNTLRKNKLLKSALNLMPGKVREKMLVRRDQAMKKLMTKPEIDVASLEKLKQIYTPDIQKLETLINRDLRHWYN